MSKSSKQYRTVVKVLNTSSETFMLVALIALFALPFVIASNLEPGIKEVKTSAVSAVTTAQAPENPDLMRLPLSQNNVNNSQQASVLGAETVSQPFEIIEEKEQFGFFNTANSTVNESAYTLSILKANKDFGKVSLFKLINNSSTEHTYSFAVQKGKSDSKFLKYVSLNFQEYQVGTRDVPANFTLAPHEEMWFGIRSNDGKGTTDLSLKVNFVK